MPDDSVDRMIADRTRRGITPEQLSASAGLPEGMVRKIERGWHTCEAGEVRRLELALGLPAGILSYANVKRLS
jgi:ribosome-binding protein aMBF1 (putative translation factor)